MLLSTLGVNSLGSPLAGKGAIATSQGEETTRGGENF